MQRFPKYCVVHSTITLSLLLQISLNVNVLVRHCKDIERELDEPQHGVGGLVPGCIPIEESAAQLGVDSTQYLMALRKKLSRLRDALKIKTNEIEAIDSRFEHARQTIAEVTHQQISRLVLELETGGNIRLEDGKPSDPWYSSCVDLMQSRFFAKDFTHCNVGGIWVQRVTRVHNRCLRNYFESRVEQFSPEPTEEGADNAKRQLEYLFAAENLQMQGELHRITEFGLRDVEELEELGLGDSIQLSNSLTFVEPLAQAKVTSAQVSNVIDSALAGIR